MKITLAWLKQNNACNGGKEWFCAQKETELSKVVLALLKDKQFDWANWTLAKAMTHKQGIQYAGYSAKQVLHLFKKQFPKDKIPRQAIKAALAYVSHPMEMNRSAAYSAADSAAYAARSAADSAAYSAYLAAWKKILKYGLKLIGKN